MKTLFSPSCVLVTGGAGFIGSNLIRWLLQHVAELDVINVDALTYAGNLENLTDVTRAHGPEGDGRYRFVRADIRDAATIADLIDGLARDPSTGRNLPRPDAVIHAAAASHVDRSILDPGEFVSTNVLGTATLLDCAQRSLAREPRPFRFINISTDEVYGALEADAPPVREDDPLTPNNPYSASKAGADCLVRAYTRTFGLPCLTIRSSNNYGPFQFPEKLIPLTTARAIERRPVPVYGDGLGIRDWLHVRDHVEAIWAVCVRGVLADEVYNVGGDLQIANIDVVRQTLALLDRPESLIMHVRDRPGHDRRYALDTTRIRERLSWAPRASFSVGLAETVEWYVANQDWWRRIESEAYRAVNALYFIDGD